MFLKSILFLTTKYLRLLQGSLFEILGKLNLRKSFAGLITLERWNNDANSQQFLLDKYELRLIAIGIIELCKLTFS